MFVTLSINLSLFTKFFVSGRVYYAYFLQTSGDSAPCLLEMPRVVVMVLAACAVPCIAPVGMQFGSEIGAACASSAGAGSNANGSRSSGTSATMLGASIGAVAAAGLVALQLYHSRTPGGSPAWQSGCSSQVRQSKGIGMRPIQFVDNDGESDDADGSDHDQESEAEDYDDECDECDYEECDYDQSDGWNGGGASSSASGKLWSKAQFPEGVVGASRYDMANLQAAQAWTCPCADRENCIGADRLKLLDLYEYRKKFVTTASNLGGLRDANRTQLENHYAVNSKSFTRSFVVGPLGDCCAASAGLANGVSFATFAASRADVTKSRGWHPARSKQKSMQEGVERAHLEAYIRSLREGLEGPKGGSQSTDTWSIEKTSFSKRWETYQRSRTNAGQPVIGSVSLFKKIWAGHREIHEITAKGHATCDECGQRAAARVPYENRTDTVAMEHKRQLDKAQVRPHLQTPHYLYANITLPCVNPICYCCRKFTSAIISGSAGTPKTGGLPVNRSRRALQPSLWTPPQRRSSICLCKSVTQEIQSRHWMVQRNGRQRLPAL